jgi:hypothetical protein
MVISEGRDITASNGLPPELKSILHNATRSIMNAESSLRGYQEDVLAGLDGAER